MKAPEVPFEEPWQAQLFALTVALNEAGHLDWPIWSARFGANVQFADAEEYWSIWSDTLTSVLEELGISQVDEVHSISRAWQRAASRTPHGEPIKLPLKGRD